jgi:hypothetical protein
MNKILIADTPLISIWVYPDRRIVHHEMKGFCYGQPFRDAQLKTAEAMERYRLTKFLTDNRAGGAVTAEDTEWAGKVWLPRAMAAGWKHWALVPPVNVIGQLHFKRIMLGALTDLGINAEVFSDPESALKWLDEA